MYVEESKKHVADTGERIRQIRAKLGLTQTDLAVLLRQKLPGLLVHGSTISRWEHGWNKPRPYVMKLLEDLEKDADGELY